MINIIYKGLYPQAWATCKLEGYIYNPDNYHDISMLSLMCTIYAHIINKRLTHWTEITETHLEQAGFRTSYSTIDSIFTLYG